MSYSDALRRRLSSAKVKEGCRISLRNGSEEYEGTVMPHHEFSDPDVIVMKMDSGYNIGIRVSPDSEIKVIGAPPASKRKGRRMETRKGLPDLVLLGTGGTIASYVDYRTGAVHPAMTASEMVDAVPEIREIANISAKVIFSIFSENMDVRHWQELAGSVAEELNNGADGVIIPHGTDTMGYTAAALSFMLQDLDRPVVLVGAQRSSDRPSSDAYSNLTAAARFCRSGRPGVYVVMHEGLEDNGFAVHIGSRVRKMHTSRRDAFKSINVPALAHIDEDGSVPACPTVPGKRGRVYARTDMERKVVLLQYYPGMDAEVFRGIFTESKGVVIAGSGLGHVNSSMIPMIRSAIDSGTVVVMTSQCLYGSTNMNVYDTGRDLTAAGVISVGDMLPETAYVKLMWALANSNGAKEAEGIMTTPLAGEMGDRRTVDG